MKKSGKYNLMLEVIDYTKKPFPANYGPNY